MPNADRETRTMMTDDQIGEALRGRGLEEEYIRELMASLGFDPNEGFTNEGIEALDNATMEQRRTAALRTLALGPDNGPEPEDEDESGSESGPGSESKSESESKSKSESESESESGPGESD